MKKVLLPIVLLAILFASCKKKDSSVSTTNTNNFKTYASMDEIFSMLALQAKVVTFDAQAGASFYGNSGTRYVFSKNSFIYANGDTVTGNVQIEVTEWLKKADMVFSGVLPVSNGKTLSSGGEIYVKATKGGTELSLRPGYQFQANIPQFGSKDTVMSYYKGDTTGGTIENKVSWTTIDSGASRVHYVIDTMNIVSSTLKYANADGILDRTRYPNWNIFQNCEITLATIGESFDKNSPIRFYVFFDDYKAVTRVEPFGTVFRTYYEQPTVPVHFVAFTLISGHFYGGVTAATPVTGQNFTVTLTEVDPADFKAQLALYP